MALRLQSEKSVHGALSTLDFLMIDAALKIQFGESAGERTAD